MNRAEEDALVLEAINGATSRNDVDGVEAIRLAIRAAVAQERERCAKWHEDRAADLQEDKLEYMVNDMRSCLSTCLLMIDAHLVSAAAIRRGE